MNMVFYYSNVVEVRSFLSVSNEHLIYAVYSERARGSFGGFSYCEVKYNC